MVFTDERLGRAAYEAKCEAARERYEKSCEVLGIKPLPKTDFDDLQDCEKADWIAVGIAVYQLRIVR